MVSMRYLSGGVAGLSILLVASFELANAQALSCAAPQKPMLDVELLLGRGKAASDARWRQFLAREVTPRFPDGLTVYETTGQWRDPATRKVVRETSRVAAHHRAGRRRRTDKIAAVAEAYKKQFRQKSVGIVTRPVCASF